MELETVEDDRGPATQDVCHVCGEANYYCDGGFYYCSLCNTQSQSARLYVDEHFLSETTQLQHTRAAILRKDKDKQTRSTKKKVSKISLTSWEVFNVVLKYMADRLVEIGFPEIVKAKILNLYVAFMMKRKVIFISKANPNAKSTVAVGEPKTNVRVFYSDYMGPPPKKKKQNPNSRGGNNGRKLKLSRKNIESAPVDDQDLTSTLSRGQKKQKEGLKKRKAMEKEYLSKTKETDADADIAFEALLNRQIQGQNQHINEIQNEKEKPRRNFRFLSLSKTTRKLRKAGLLPGNMKHKLLLTRRRLPFQRPRSKLTTAARLVTFERFTIRTCLSLVFVALRQVGCPVILSDIIRLYHVGLLSLTFQEITALANGIGEYKKMAHVEPLLAVHYKMEVLVLADIVQLFVDYVGVKTFRYPQVKEIVPKFMDDFVLPREFECFVSLLNHAIPFEEMLKDVGEGVTNTKITRHKIVPEVLTLVQIIVVLKMFFGLDDRTERFQSKFAQLVNRVMKDNFKKEMKPWTELFVIEDWFAYLLRRKELIRKEMSTSEQYSPNEHISIAKLNELLERDLSLSDNRDGGGDDAAAKENSKSGQQLLQNILTDAATEIPKLQPYIPLPLPNQSIVEQYLDRFPVVNDPSFKLELFKVDFTDKRIDFIWNPGKYAKYLKLYGYEIKVIHGDAVNNFPIEMEKELDKSNVAVVFQPYKSFDEFIGIYRAECSSSMKLLLGLCEEIIPDSCASKKGYLNSQNLLMQKLVNNLGDKYIQRILAEHLPILVRWDEATSSDSD